MELQPEPHLLVAHVGPGRWIAEGRLHPVAVAHRHHLDRRGQGRALVDDHLTARAREGAYRSDPPAADRYAFSPLSKEQIDHILDVFEVHDVAGLAAEIGAPRAVPEIDLDPRPTERSEAGVRTQVGDLVPQRLGGGRAARGVRLDGVDLRT